MDRDRIIFEFQDEEEGVTCIMGSYTLPDGRKAAAYERIHGKYYVCPLPGAGYWVKYPQYDAIVEKAQGYIATHLSYLVDKPQ